MAPPQKSTDAKKPTAQPKAPGHEALEREQLNQPADAARLLQRALAAPQPPPLNPNDILTLQRTLGNRAVNRLLAQPANLQPRSRATLPIQARLTLGPANDRYEQEADRVAARVVGQITAPQSRAVDSNASLRRQPVLEDEELQPGAGPVRRQAAGQQPTEEERPPRLLADSIQGRLLEEDEELKRQPLVQRQPAASGLEVPDTFETSIQTARGGGQPLAENVRTSMENAFGADFSGVKVHTDAGADTLNRSVQARAFTTGQDIFFRQGEYQPGNKAGQQLIAHELTHVVQQNGQGASAAPIRRWSLKSIAGGALGGLLGFLGGAFYQAGVDAYQWGKSAYDATNGNILATGLAGLGGLIKGALWGPFRGAYLGGWQGSQSNRPVSDLVKVDTSVPELSNTQLTDLLGIHGGINSAGLTQIGQAFAGNAVGGRPLADIIQLANGVAGLTAPQVIALTTIHAGINLAGLTQIGQAVAANGVGGRAPADIVQLANGAPGLTAPQVIQLTTIHAGINPAGLVQIGQAFAANGVGGRPLPHIVQLANGEQGLTAPQVITLTTMHVGINVLELIQIAQAVVVAGAGARPLADVVTLANGMHALTAAQLAQLAILNVGGALGEYIVQDGIHWDRTADDLITQAHNANLPARQTVANHTALRAVVRGRWGGGDATAIMATLLEGSLYWPRGSGPDQFDNYRILGGTTFADWIRGGNENANRPAADAISDMNCWEGVLFAAYLAGKLTYNDLTQVHDQAAQAGDAVDDADDYYDVLAHFLNAHNSVMWDPAALAALPRGNIVFFTDPNNLPHDRDKLEHVAISLGGVGGNVRIMSLWNLPGNTFRYLTINQLLNAAGAQDIYHAPAPW